MIGLSNVAQAQRSDSIAAVVNDDVVTYTDLYDRMNLVMTSARMPDTKDFKERILPQILTGLITERIQMQEAERLGLSAAQEEIDREFASLAQQNNLQPAQFKGLLQRDGINIATLEKQMAARLAWGKVIQREIRPRVQLSDSDIQDEIARLRLREGQEEYFIAEIFLPYGESADAAESKVRATARDLSRQLRQDSSKFPAAARQFSQSATAGNGGTIGWVTADQMSDDIGLTLRNLKVKTVSQPIKGDEGYSIIFLRDKRTVNLNPARVEERLRIKLAEFPLPDDQVARNVLRKDIDLFMRDVRGCLDIVRQMTRRDNATLRDFDNTVSNLPKDLVEAVRGVDIGDTGKTIETDTMIQVPMVCGREGDSSTVALEREVEGRIGMQRMDVLQKRYLRDLIAEAYIERRV